MAEKAIETGNLEEILGVIPTTYTGEVRTFFHVRNKRKYTIKNIAAGREYVSVFINFIRYLTNLLSVNP